MKIKSLLGIGASKKETLKFVEEYTGDLSSWSGVHPEDNNEPELTDEQLLERYQNDPNKGVFWANMGEMF